MDKDKIIDGLRMTMDLCVFDPSTGEEKDPDGLNDLDRATYDACKGALEILEQLPPAQPERIKGHWIESAGQNILLKKLIEKGETWRVCDKCGAGFMIGYQYECDKAYHETFHNFCPNCGADMREVTA